MRAKRKKQVRRTVKFFKSCFGFREPFKILCDGTFIHNLLHFKHGTPSDAIPALLGAQTKIFVTRCISEEIRKLGEQYSESMLAARTLMLARCNHETLKSATECFESMIGSDNPDRFFAATQDVELRRKFRQVRGVPIIFVQKSLLLFEPPSEYQLEIAKMSEAERTHVNEKEFKLIEAREAKKAKVCDEAGLNDEKPTSVEAFGKSKIRNNLAVKDCPQFKKKRAKGPNPLSRKKKKKSIPAATSINHESQDGNTTEKKKKIKQEEKKASKCRIEWTIYLLIRRMLVLLYGIFYQHADN